MIILETSWNLEIDGIIVGSGGSYSISGPQTSEEIINMPNGDYTFTINDTYGDGICCAYGQGSYSVLVNSVETISGGEFGSSESTNFSI